MQTSQPPPSTWSSSRCYPPTEDTRKKKKGGVAGSSGSGEGGEQSPGTEPFDDADDVTEPLNGGQLAAYLAHQLEVCNSGFRAQ